MPHPSPPAPHIDPLPHPARWALILGLFFLYLAVWPQGQGSVDEEFIYRTTHSLVHRGSLQFPADDLVNADTAPKLVASKYGVLPSLGAVPFHLVGLALPWLAPDALRDEIVRTATYSASGLWMALTAVQLAAAFASMGFRRKVQLAGALLFALATPALVYARFFHVTAMATLLVAAMFLAAVRFEHRPDARQAAWLGSWLGLLLLVGFNFVVVLPVLVIFVAWTSKLRRLPNVLALLAPVVAGWALVIAVNLLRDHDWFRGGYQGEAFVTPLAFGLYGLLFGAGRGLFFYSPLSVAGVLLLPALWRSRRRLAWLVAAMLLLVAVSYAKWFAWNGGTYWGPRYLVPLLPLLIVPLANYLEAWRDKPLAGRVAFVALVLVAMAVQARGVRTHYYAAAANTAPLALSQNEQLFVPQLQPLWWKADAPLAFLWTNWYRRGYASLAIGLALASCASAVVALGYVGFRTGIWRSTIGALPLYAWTGLLAAVAALALVEAWRTAGHGLARNTSFHTLPPVDFNRPRWRWQSPVSGATTWSGYLRVPQNGDYVLLLQSAGTAQLTLSNGPDVPVEPQLDHPGGQHWRTWAGRLNAGLFGVDLAVEPGPSGHAEVSLLWTMHGNGIDRQPIDPQYLYPTNHPSATRLFVDRLMGMAWLAILWVGLATVAIGGKLAAKN